MYTDS
jgi:hypothetical protein